MARVCEICGRGKKKAISRSHSNIATKRYQLPNLQSVMMDGKSVLACTQCLKTYSKRLADATA